MAESPPNPRITRRQALRSLSAGVGALLFGWVASAHHRPGHQIPPGHRTTTSTSSTTTTTAPTTTTSSTTTTTQPTTTTTQPTTTTTAPTTTTTAPTTSGSYGAGVQGAALAIPGNAVAATPSNLASLINSHPSGTNFALAAGTYIGSFPNKGGNGYFGNPANHRAVVFDGQTTYPNTNDGTAPNGGAYEAFAGGGGNTWANLMIQRYRGRDDLPGNGPIHMGGTTDSLFRNLELKWMAQSGLRLAGQRQKIQYVTSWHNGRYCFNGNGANHLLSNCDGFGSGDDAVSAANIIPRVSDSNRGISKFNHSTSIETRDSWYHDIRGPMAKGLWWDGNNRKYLAENCLITDIERVGIVAEISHDGIIRNNVLRNVGWGAHQWPWVPAAILSATGGKAEITGNQIDGCYHGIILYQNNRDHNPDHWSAGCGSVIRGNTITKSTGSVIGTHVTYTKDGCNFNTDPSKVTIQNNSTPGAQQFWFNTARTPAQWAALGYS